MSASRRFGTALSRNGCPYPKVLAISCRRAWQNAQVSISLLEERGAVRAAVPTAGSKIHRPPLVSASRATRPIVPLSATLVGNFAQATWRDPGPWQASQETSNSDHVV